MKTTAKILTLIASISTAFAGFSEKKLENTKQSATKSGKNIAFVFYQDFYAPNCPKCIRAVNANNAAIDKAVPGSAVKVVEIVKGDKDLDKLPSIVPQSGKLPRVVVTDASCEKILAKLDGAPNRDQSTAFSDKVKAAGK